MANETSVSVWIDALRRGDSVAASNLWARYFLPLVLHARGRMTRINPSLYDEEDAALSTFRVICTKLKEGQYASLADRDELWHLMVTIVNRKIGRRARYQSAVKRKGGREQVPMTSIEDPLDASSEELFQEFVELIGSLKNPQLEQIALLRFEGYTNDEIAIKLNCTRRTIQRMLNLIRNLWQETLNCE